ncbi:protein PLANT CADMIUM RESISTANCE 3-like [Vigna umbellata]|uniref:protein PLANT CADMIUM RESISTANCE 3-like n=1 Tax=Vigna umbellata TaxID=87088 RepID=UPI001F5ED27C|nr:protein PLANT CADMIUM RESISTANCE 3-like [Vigna umbellata]
MSEKVADGSWSTGLCDCFSDCGSCCLTLWCPCVSFGRVAEILDKGKTSCCFHGSLFYLLAGLTQLGGCIYAWLYRAKLREVYGIEGHHCKDCLVSFLCLHLAICQEYRELKVRGFDISAGWEGNVQMYTRGVTSAPEVEGGMSR